MELWIEYLGGYSLIYRSVAAIVYSNTVEKSVEINLDCTADQIVCLGQYRKCTNRGGFWSNVGGEGGHEGGGLPSVIFYTVARVEACEGVYPYGNDDTNCASTTEVETMRALFGG